ncbi:hypothetical protein HDV06_004645 [Boothiomyces sp. JEL0866]|nr:hypothetical protein HDV06_004645 [Boothiomyces sp. JEL0866]
MKAMFKNLFKPKQDSKISEFEKKYFIGKELGKGAYATVKIVTRKTDSVKFAVKIIDKKKMKGEEEAVKQEIDILSKIRNPHIVSLVDLCTDKEHYYLVMDLATGGELFDRILSKGSYGEKDAAKLVAQILTALDYLHNIDIVHRDLKPENLLFRTESEDSDLLLADFGLSRVVHQNEFLKTSCGTPHYVAPEILKESGHGKPVDMWSLGVITYVLLCGYTPFWGGETNSVPVLYNAIVNGKYEFDEENWSIISKDAKDFISKLLLVNPSKRMTVKEAAAHPWLSTENNTNLLDNVRKNFSARTTLRKAVNAQSEMSRVLEITDSLTGETFPITINEDTIDTKEFAKLGLTVYDNGYLNTAVCRSAISYIDGDKGILRYRGYDIEDLANNSSFLEVSYLLIFGNLPTKDQFDALSTLHPEANTALNGTEIYDNEAFVNKQIFRCLAKLPTIAACAYRHRIGRSYNMPSEKLEYKTNYAPHPKLAHALDVIFILHADHELNCSTAAMRQMASTGIDPFICLSGASSALYGPSHGGANEAALKMLEEIGSVENIPAFIEEVKAKKRRLMGFGHRVYKSYDPRAKILKKISAEVFEVMGRSNLIDIAMELERIALNDEYFIKRNLYPNVDFYSGIIYKMMGFPTDFFPVLFTLARTAGWLAHWKEQMADQIPIFRPRQVYVGEEKRDYVPMHQRNVEDPKLHLVKSRKELVSKK